MVLKHPVLERQAAGDGGRRQRAFRFWRIRFWRRQRRGAWAPVFGICSASIFAGAPRPAEAPSSYAEPGSSLEYQIEISFWEAVRGTVKKLSIARLDTCTDCHGTGQCWTAPPPPGRVCGGTRDRWRKPAGGCDSYLTCTRCGAYRARSEQYAALVRRRWARAAGGYD